MKNINVNQLSFEFPSQTISADMISSGQSLLESAARYLADRLHNKIDIMRALGKSAAFVSLSIDGADKLMFQDAMSATSGDPALTGIIQAAAESNGKISIHVDTVEALFNTLSA